MSLYETRDCGHSEIVLAKKCRTCEDITKEKELEDLRWFRDQINSRVMPGEMDSADSAYDLIQRLRAALEQIAAPTYGTELCNTDEENNEILGHHMFWHQSIARKALGR